MPTRRRVVENDIVPLEALTLPPELTPADLAPRRRPGLAPATSSAILERVRRAIRARHYSHRTEKAYLGWIRRYFAFYRGREISTIGAAEVSSYLSHLAVSR